jgi:hypothetical protein
MPTTFTELSAPELLSPLGECASAFAEVAAPIAGGDVAAVPLGPLARSWDAYYFGPFSRFDALLRAHVEAGGQEYARYLPVSISHHNLHRLIEALRREVGEAPLGQTRIPERLLDLEESCGRLGHLLGSASGGQSASAVRQA